MAARVVFLDRDGTINVDYGYVYSPEKFEFTEKAPEALHLLKEAGYKLAIITNQSGIGHGLYSEDDMHALHNYMNKQLETVGASIDVIAFCPHERGQVECGCRKPQTGMADQIAESLGDIDYAQSWTVGDKEADLQFGKNLHTKTALVRSTYWSEEELQNAPDIVVDSLWEFATKVS